MHINWAAIAAEMTLFMNILGGGSFDVFGATDMIILNRILHHCISADGFIYTGIPYTIQMYPKYAMHFLNSNPVIRLHNTNPPILKLWGRRTASNDHNIICYIFNLLSL